MMAQETKELPALAKTAFAQLQQAITQQIEMISGQVLDVMGLDVKDGWRVDAQGGKAIRTVPDVVPDTPVDTPPDVSGD